MKRAELRYFREEDWPYILALHVEQERQLGRQMDLPDLSQRPVISCLVATVDDKITNYIFMEAEVEVCAGGSRPLSNTVLRSAVMVLMRDAQRYNIRLARAFVPVQALRGTKKHKPAVKRILDAAGFTEVDETMVDFYRWIPEAEVEA